MLVVLAVSAPSDGEAVLLACPFCGSTQDAPIESVVHLSMNEHDWRDPSWTVQCDGCTATMGYSDSPEDAIAAWNRRPSRALATDEARHDR